MLAVRYRRQHGAVLPMVAVCLVALIASMLLVLDSGRMYLAQNDLQKDANLAALDAARTIGGCQGAVDDPLAATQTAARSSLQRNNADPDILDNAGSSVTLGQITAGSDHYTFSATAPDQASAVRVHLSRPAPSLLTPLLAASPGGTMVATAAAYSQPTVGLSVGGGLLNLDPTASTLLGPVLGGLLGIPPGQLDISLADFKGLANVNVTLLQLLKLGTGIGTIGDFLKTPISAPQFLSLLGDAVSQVDSSVAGPLLYQLASLADPSRTVVPDDFLDVAQDSIAQAARLPINAAQLLMALAETAGQGQPVHLPLTLDLPGVTSAKATVRLTRPATIAVGRPGYYADGTPRAISYSAQGLVEVDLKLSPTLVTGLLNGLTLGLLHLSATTELHLYAKLAQSSAVPAELFCATVDQPHHLLDVDTQTGIASLGLGEFDDIDGPNPQPQPSPPVVDLSIALLGGLLPVADIKVDATTAPVTVGSYGATRVEFQGPFVPVLQQPSSDNTKSVNTQLGPALSGALGDLSGSLDLQTHVSLLGAGLPTGTLDGIVSALVSGLSGALSPVLTGLGDALLNPLFSILGLDLGTGTVTVSGVYPSQPDTQWGGYRPVVELTNSD